jgi:aryl-alcohol dehydrogenase-like predicted oxidoreductase
MNDPRYTPRTPSMPPPLVLGTMNFGRRTPEPEAKKIIARALERGVTLFDTANAYNDGESERILGRALGPARHDVHIATKVGWWKKEGLSGDRIRASLDESLARLGRDHVDLYYFHVPDPSTPIEESLTAIGTLVASGRIAHFGISNYASWQALELLHAAQHLGLPRPAVSQQLYNLLIRQLDLEYFRFAAKYALHTTVYNPLAGGLLARTSDEIAAAPARGSRFDKNPLYQRRYLSDVFFEATRSYAALAQELGMDLVTLAYAWLAQRPGVDSILVGPGSVAHLDDALDAIATPLPSQAIDAIDAIHRDLVGTDASYAR